MTQPAPPPRPALPFVSLRWQVTLWVAMTFLATAQELRSWLDPLQRAARFGGWLADAREDFFPTLLLLWLAPLFYWGLRNRKAARAGSFTEWLDQGAGAGSRWLTITACGVLFTLATLLSFFAGDRSYHLPPAYHDEFSYLLQAETFASGKLWLEGFGSSPELFDQMHVLNEGRFASRYFPGTGLWLTLGLALGNVWSAQHLAHGLCAMLMFLTGRELTSNRVGLLAGLLLATSPGVLLFSTLLLAHLPTLVGLLTFFWSYLRWMRTGSTSSLWLAGIGLTFAMLCRPMTAAGFALPCGIYFIAWWVGLPVLPLTSDVPPLRRVFRAAPLAVPILAGLVASAAYNQQITGSLWLSPYQQYTDVYTPRHRYGFGNVRIGEQRLGPKVIDNYDRWAKDLTPALAAENVRTRLVNSWRWTLGIVPLWLGVGAWLVTCRKGDRRWWLVAAGIVSLHVVHIPYWFEGIMGWHYVFETAPLWLLLFAEGWSRLRRTWSVTGCWGARLWWTLLVSVTIAANLFTIAPVWRGRLPTGQAELAFSREHYARFQESAKQLAAGKPAIVFVLPDPSDVSLDFVTNLPSQAPQLLVARLRDQSRLTEFARQFPDRVPLLFDAASKQFLEFPADAVLEPKP